MPVMEMHAGKARRFLMQRPPIDVVLYAKRSGRKLPCVKRPSHSAADTFAVGMITPSRAIPVLPLLSLLLRTVPPQQDQQLGAIERGRIHWETENPHCFCSISICFVIRMAFCA